MSEPEIETRNRFSAVWLIPLAALVFALALVVHSQLNEGPQIEIRFADADGISAGETEVKRLAVTLGVVSEVRLNEGFNDVTVVVRLNQGTESLLLEDTQFWVVKPRIGAGGVSGLSTILSGAYIELSPGQGARGKREFVGLDDIPTTPQSTPGIRLVLVSDGAASITVGSPVLYNGYTVGRVETSELKADGKANYTVFIDAPYDDLVTSSTRFWNASGLQIEADASGFALRTESLESLLTGGIAFGLPDNQSPGVAVEPNTQFDLEDDYAAINEPTFGGGSEYLLMFDSSIRGLQPGAAVDYRGVRMGTVLKVAFDLPNRRDSWSELGRAQMPVLIRLDPQRLGARAQTGLSANDQAVADAISGGLRASLATGNLLTGSLYIDLDFYDNLDTAEVRALDKWIVLPTVETGIAQIERQVSNVLENLQDLPVEDAVVTATQTLENLSAALKTADKTLIDIGNVLDQPETRALPANINKALNEVEQTLAGLDSESPLYEDLRGTLANLTHTLREAERVLTTINNQPNSLVFSSRRPPDPEPKVKK